MQFLRTPALCFAVAIGFLCQTCNTGERFSLNTQSPNKKYTVRLEGTKKPPNALPGEFYVYQVKLTALRDSKAVLEDPEFYSEDRYEPSFLQAFPLQRWINDSVVRLGGDSIQPFHDEISLFNATQEHLDLVIVRYGKYERFLVFDLNPGAKIQLLASPQLDKEWAASEVHYTAYHSAQSFSGSAGQFRSRKVEEGPQKVSVDLIDIPNTK